MPEGLPIEDSITIRAPRADVFRALTDATALGCWMATRAESDPRPGGRFRYVFEFDDPAQNNVQEGRYVAVERPQRLVLPWTFPFSDQETTVEYTLSGDADETELAFRHSGFGTGEPWDGARERFAGGWRLFLQSLKAHVEDGADARPLGIKPAAAADT